MALVFFAACLLLSASSGAFCAPVIQTGHLGPVNCLAYSEENGGLVFSGGDDGTLKVFSPLSLRLIASMRASSGPVGRLAVNPGRTQAAVLEITGTSSSEIHIWDWKKCEKLYSIELDTIPLFFAYSASGTHFIYCKPEIRSMYILNAKTGETEERFAAGFGMVSFVTTSKTEKNLMTYQPSGKITYWELATEKKIAGYPKATLPDLSNVTVSDSKRFVAASSGNNLVIVDLVSGELAAKTELAGIAGITISKDGTEIVAIAKSISGTTAYKYSFDGNKLAKIELAFHDPSSSKIKDCLYAGKNLYFATGEGDIKRLEPGGSMATFSRNRLAIVNDIVFHENFAGIGVGSRILTFPYSVIEGKETLEETETGAFSFIESPFTGEIGFSILDSNRFWIWGRSEESKKLIVFDIKARTQELEYDFFESQIEQVHPMGRKLLALDASGNLIIAGNDTQEPLFKYSAQGLNMAIPVYADTLVAARNKIGKNSSSLVIINSKTGETVPLAEPSNFCYNLMFEPNSKRLYYIGIERDSSQSMTSLRYRYGKFFENIKTIAVYRGEDFGASIAASDKMLYTSLGNDSISVTDGTSIESFIQPASVPRRLFIRGKILYSVNSDRSISLYDLVTRVNLFNVYLFEDLEWIAVYPDGSYINSPGALKYIPE